MVTGELVVVDSEGSGGGVAVTRMPRTPPKVSICFWRTAVRVRYRLPTLCPPALLRLHYLSLSLYRPYARRPSFAVALAYSPCAPRPALAHRVSRPRGTGSVGDSVGEGVRSDMAAQ